MSSKSAETTRRYVVSGRVQGVGFRWFVEREAMQLGLRGWVRNRQDGCVKTLAQGSEDDLRTFYQKLKEGPRAARVDQVDVAELPQNEKLPSFRIEETW